MASEGNISHLKQLETCITVTKQLPQDDRLAMSDWIKYKLNFAEAEYLKCNEKGRIDYLKRLHLAGSELGVCGLDPTFVDVLSRKLLRKSKDSTPTQPTAMTHSFPLSCAQIWPRAKAMQKIGGNPCTLDVKGGKYRVRGTLQGRGSAEDLSTRGRGNLNIDIEFSPEDIKSIDCYIGRRQAKFIVVWLHGSKLRSVDLEFMMVADTIEFIKMVELVTGEQSLVNFE